MDVESLKKRVVAALAQNDFILTFHAQRVRMPERNVRRADIVECGKTAKECLYDSKRDTYKVRGNDLDGDELTVVAGIDGEVVVITVY